METNQSIDKISYYAIIPANVRYDKTISNGAKLLYAEITSLCNQKGYCWATNEYFGNLYNVNNRTIQRWLIEMKNREYIILNYDKDRNREIFITKENLPDVNYDKNVIPPRDKNVIPPVTKMSYPRDKNVADKGVTLYKNNKRNNKEEYILGNFSSEETNAVNSNDKEKILNEGKDIEKEDSLSKKKASRKNKSFATLEETLEIVPAEILNTQGFKESWEDWYNQRKELKKPLTLTTVKYQCKRLLEIYNTDNRQLPSKIISYAITRNWQGFYCIPDNMLEKETNIVTTETEIDFSKHGPMWSPFDGELTPEALAEYYKKKEREDRETQELLYGKK